MTLADIEPWDIDDVLGKIQTSFNIQFKKNEIAQMKTFGEFCDHIISKTRFGKKEDCTTQQAFYKLRNAISIALSIPPREILPETKLEELIPRKSRRRNLLPEGGTTIT